MYSCKLLTRLSNHLDKKRCLHTSMQMCCEGENPILRTFRILASDIISLGKNRQNEENKYIGVPTSFPDHADVVIIGGGGIGSSIAYWLKQMTNVNALRVVVVEKDMTYAKSSTALSVGGLRQQFSLSENIQMSLYGADFLRTLKKRFGRDADVSFTPHGYLVLASELGAPQLIEQTFLQKELGAINILLSKEELKKRFPWMDVTDVELGCLGLEKEGWFDPWSLLNILRKGAIDSNVQYVTGEVVDFGFQEQEEYIIEGVEEGSFEGIQEIAVKTPDNEIKRMKFGLCVIAAGADSGDVAKLAKIGVGPGMLSIPLPVEKRKRYVFHFNCNGTAPGINTPMTIDHSGVYFRREGYGGSFICGLSPEPEEEPSVDNLDVDHSFFDNKIWPILAKRVPAFNSIKVCGSWGGYYEYNVYDENGIIGPHPYYQNLYVATGFSGHGIQQAPAVGRAIAELILEGKFRTIDLTRLGFDRIIVRKPMYEVNII